MAERLIDANKLKKRKVVTVDGVFKMGATEEDIDNAPAIDAIPIEWLEQRYPPAVMTDSTAYITKVRVIDEVIRAWRAERKEE